MVFICDTCSILDGWIRAGQHRWHIYFDLSSIPVSHCWVSVCDILVYLYKDERKKQKKKTRTRTAHECKTTIVQYRIVSKKNWVMFLHDFVIYLHTRIKWTKIIYQIEENHDLISYTFMCKQSSKLFYFWKISIEDISNTSQLQPRRLWWVLCCW